MKNSITKTNIFFLSLSILFVLSDQASKLAVKGFNFLGIQHTGLRLGEQIPVIGNFLQITYIENAGMAFGITFGSGKIILSLFSVVASIGLCWFLIKLTNYSKAVQFGTALLLAGAVGNLIDRVFYGVFYGASPLFYGRVVDFIQVDIPDITIFGVTYNSWPIFNFADSFVTCGIIILLIFHKIIPDIRLLRASAPNHKHDEIDTAGNNLIQDNQNPSSENNLQ
ncbi:MAG: lspA [Ignavibacteria bacterium]|nr:lspA [Ignavibacteria bacterium]